METRTQRKNGTTRVQLRLDPKSKVEQSHKKKCNINTIMSKFSKSGLLPQRKEMPKYGDFATAFDYHEAKNRLLQAEKDFMSLPSGIRKKFNNDAGYLVEFLNDPENIAQAQEMGLLPKPPAEPVIVPKAATEPLNTDTEPALNSNTVPKDS